MSLTHLYLNQESSERKGMPLATGVLDYFPAALAYVAKVSKYGNDKHNPGQPLHHARGKSMDHADCIARHIVDRGGIEPDTGLRHSGFLAWRALALLQEELEREEGAPLPRAAKVEEPHPDMKPKSEMVPFPVQDFLKQVIPFPPPGGVLSQPYYLGPGGVCPGPNAGAGIYPPGVVLCNGPRAVEGCIP